MLAADVARGVEALDADVVEIARAMHGRARVGLGDDQQVGHARVGADLRRQRGEARRDVLASGSSRRMPRLEPGTIFSASCPSTVDEIVAAVAEEREVVVGEPATGTPCPRPAPPAASAAGARRARRRSPSSLSRIFFQSATAMPHVAEHARDVGGQRVEPRRLGHAVDLDVDERFAPRVARIVRRDVGERPVGAAHDRDDRMDDEVQRQAVAVDFHRHRIDEERHVVVDDLDDRVRRLPAVLLDRRIEDAHAGVARLALAREVPVRQRRAVQVGRRALGEVLGIDLAEVADDEALEHVALHRRRPGPHQPEHEVELLRPAVIRRRFIVASEPFAVDRTAIRTVFTRCRCTRARSARTDRSRGRCERRDARRPRYLAACAR